MIKRSLAISLLLIGTCIASAQANFSAADYWQLNKARLELAAMEWQERITAAEQARGDRKVLLARSTAITKQFAEAHRSLHAKFGTNPQAYLHFATDHAKEVQSYLEDEQHVDVKRELEQLRENVQTLMQRFDSVAEPMLRENK
jgi:hypothetical protein